MIKLFIYETNWESTNTSRGKNVFNPSDIQLGYYPHMQRKKSTYSHWLVNSSRWKIVFNPSDIQLRYYPHMQRSLPKSTYSHWFIGIVVEMNFFHQVGLIWHVMIFFELFLFLVIFLYFCQIFFNISVCLDWKNQKAKKIIFFEKNQVKLKWTENVKNNN